MKEHDARRYDVLQVNTTKGHAILKTGGGGQAVLPPKQNQSRDSMKRRTAVRAVGTSPLKGVGGRRTLVVDAKNSTKRESVLWGGRYGCTNGWQIGCSRSGGCSDTTQEQRQRQIKKKTNTGPGEKWDNKRKYTTYMKQSTREEK